MRPNGMKLSPRHRIWFYASFIFVFFSGLAWMVLHYAGPQQDQMEAGIHPLEPWALKVHGAAAMLVLIILGTLIPLHMKRGWAAGINRRNGIILISVNLVLIVTGYLLYYAGEETFRLTSHWVHIIIGMLLPGFIIWHVREGRLERKKLRHRHPKRVAHRD